MCGIAGYKVNRIVNGSVIKGMVGALFHRGPDADGYYSSGPYCAGMRRLMINDLKTGNQPLFSEDKNIVLFYNGEIYNSGELRKQLELKGHYFKTHSDGEVICHLYEEYGERLFEKLDGMFAVALWIENERKLILARDIPGEKPLYFSQLPGQGIVFASEIKSLKLFPALDLTLNYQAIWDFPTFHWIPEPSTIYKSIYALLPQHILVADVSGIKIERYANTFDSDTVDAGDDQSLIKETRRIIEKAVQSRLLSDVPIGAFLSGGLDSSIVATLAMSNLDRLDTFTIGFEDVYDPYHGMADESINAENYAKKLGSRHHSIRVNSPTFLNLLNDFSKYGDQPFAVPSALGILAVAKAAHSAGIKVLLSGDGADECFGGYSWYNYLIPEQKVDQESDSQDSISFHNFGMDLNDKLKSLYSYKPQKRAWAWHYYASESEKRLLFSEDIFGSVNSSLRFFHQYKKDSCWMPEDFIGQDRSFYLPNEMLRKVDRMTMAYSVEGRVPFVAPYVLSLADKLKYRSFVRDRILKWILRKAFEDMLPAEILSRPKHGFNVPVDYWLKGEWNFLVKESFSRESALFKYGLISENSLNIADLMLKDKIRFNGNTIFAYVMLNMWFKNEKNYAQIPELS